MVERVLQVIGSLNNGGSQAMIMNLYRNIDRSKIQFDFIVFYEDEDYYQEEIESLGGKVYSISNFKGLNINQYCSEWSSFFKNNPEYKIIHGHVRSTASIYLSIAKKFGLVTIAHSHSTSNGIGINAVVKTCLQYPIRYVAEYLFACSEESGIWLYGKNLKKKSIIVINNAIDSNKYVFNNDIRVRIRKELGLEGKYVIGHVGRFSYPKNHEFIIDIFNSVSQMSENAVLVLIGSGDLQNSIMEKSQKLGIENSIHFLGIRSDVADLMQAMDLFLFPSIHEGLPVALVEAQASGLQCLVSKEITTEIELTDLVEYIDLNTPWEIWAERVLEYDNSYPRQNTQKKMTDAEYDIVKSANMIENFYMNRISDLYDNKK